MQHFPDLADDERLRQYRYAFAQAVIFGVPVAGLQFFGAKLGGSESPRWAGLFGALLAGWVMYVAVAGMLVEGIMRVLARRRLRADVLPAAVAAGIYVAGLAAVIGLLCGRRGLPAPRFVWCVAIAVLWNGLQWARLARAA